jgi:polyphosphate kinase 2 (PPK2 family)
MLIKTSTIDAPWTVVEANCKRFARVKTLRVLADVMDAGLHSSAAGTP